MSMWGLGKVVSRPPAEFEALDDTTNNFKGVADKVIKWVPGDILALYAAGVVAFDATKPALRVSGLDGGEEGPVGSAGVEQAADAVVSEVHQSERDALDPFREVVHGFGRAVRDV